MADPQQIMETPMNKWRIQAQSTLGNRTRTHVWSTYAARLVLAPGELEITGQRTEARGSSQRMARVREFVNWVEIISLPVKRPFTATRTA